MRTEVFNHDSEMDMVHKINTLELENWINHLNYVHRELDSLTVFYRKQRDRNLESASAILERFEIIYVDNSIILKSLIEHSNARKNAIECDSTACDMSFISEHETYRRLYLFHIDKYRKQKDMFFNQIKENAFC